MIITIDGPTASGKSTVAEALAKKLGYTYINSGLLFRAVAYLLHTENLTPKSAEFKSQVPKLFSESSSLHYYYSPSHGAQILYNDEDITPLLKTPTIDKLSSHIALLPEIRDILLQVQKTIAQSHNVIAEGRDTGTVVFPEADTKLYITASLDVRADRWQKAQERKGKSYSLEESKQIIDERDTRDSEREIAPLTIPQGAMVIDTSDMTVEDVVAACIHVVQA